MNIEPLEARIAPAKILNIIDVDGDIVTITTTKGTDLDLDIAVNTTFMPPGAVTGGVQIDLINLTGNAVFDGTSISITVKRGPSGGDGLVNVGSIDATGLDLGTVTVKGDLGNLDGGKNSTTGKIAAINVHSTTSSAIWSLAGSVGSLTVKTNVTGTEITVTGVGASLGKVAIGGSLVGTSVNASGYIHVDDGTLGKVTIGGSIVGGSTADSGKLRAKVIGSVTVGGSLVGGSGNSSGQIISQDFAGSIGPVVIKGDVRGGSNTASGQVRSLGTLGAVTVGGSLLGGAGGDTGVIDAQGSIGKVTIGRDVVGSSNADGGGIRSRAGGIAGVTIGGDLVGGVSSGTGFISAKGGNLGPIVIRGDLYAGPAGGSGMLPINAGIILAQIGAAFDANFASITSITIGGSVVGRGDNDNAQIFADGSIGPVKIGGDLRGGSGFGSGELLAGKTLGFVTIGGSVLGGSGTNSGAIEAPDKIAGVKIGGTLATGGTSFGGRITSNSVVGVIGPITIGGDLIGSTISAGVLGAISIRGNATGADITAGDGSSTTVLQLKSLTIGGSATRLNVGVLGPDGSIGPVKVGGDWREGGIHTRITPGSDGYGNNNDFATSTGDPLIFSKIASITIGGAVIGTVGGADHFGFVAQQIGALKIGGTKIPLQPGNGNDTDALASRYLISATRDFTVHEVA